jgi:threonine dehydrogenase-like Zn-dependent dehydrogenase
LLAGQICAPRKIELIDVPEPALEPASSGDEPGEIIFQPELACLCGSDIPFFQADPDCIPQVGHSLHEMIGTVVDTNGRRFKPGDRVLCVPVFQVGLWERFRVTEMRAIPLDPSVPEDQAVLAQPLGTVIYALRKLPNLLDWNVAIVGQGPMGLLITAALRNVGARQIIAVDRINSRLDTSVRMGATAVVNPENQDPAEAVRELTDGVMADLVIEAVGHREQVFNLCTDLCREQGRILFFGVPPAKIDGLRWLDLFMKNINVQTTVNPDFERDFPLAMRWIAEGRIDVSPLITNRLPLARIQEAFELYEERRDGELKVFVDFPAGKN